MTAALLEYETIDAEQINDIMAGKPVREPKPRQAKVPPAAGSSSSGSTPAAAGEPQHSANT